MVVQPEKDGWKVEGDRGGGWDGGMDERMGKRMD